MEPRLVVCSSYMSLFNEIKNVYMLILSGTIGVIIRLYV